MVVRKLIQEKKTIDIFDVSIDKLTIMGDVKSYRLEDFQKLVNHSSSIDLWKVGSVAEGKLFNKIFFTFDPEKAKVMNRRALRMEFNPKHISCTEKDWLLENVLPLLTNIGLSRLDIAFDCDYNLAKFAYIQKIQTKRTKIESRKGDLETLYLGTRTSEKMVRIYNKAVELQERKKKILQKFENGIGQYDIESYEDLRAELREIEKTERPVWWRLEFELKRDAITIGQSIFDNLMIKEPKINSRTVPSIQDRAMLEYLERHPNEISELAKGTKAKYRKMMRELVDENDEDLTEQFKNELEKRKNDLVGQVATWIGLKPNELFV